MAEHLYSELYSLDIIVDVYCFVMMYHVYIYMCVCVKRSARGSFIYIYYKNTGACVCVYGLMITMKHRFKPLALTLHAEQTWMNSISYSHYIYMYCYVYYLADSWTITIIGCSLHCVRKTRAYIII